MKARKKPVVIKFVKWDGKNVNDVKAFAGECISMKGNDLYIQTLEGTMFANVGDYIIKGVNGEFYPCKPDIFEKTYDIITDECGMETGCFSFSEAIEVLKQGGIIRRQGWNGKDIVVFKQVPAHIESDIIPKMQSLPEAAKKLIMGNDKQYIDYTSQCLIYNKATGIADSWVPSISDVFANDWERVE